jgi:hypothetical protein
MKKFFKLPWKAILTAVATIIAFDIGGNAIFQYPIVGIIFLILGFVLFVILYHLRNAFLNTYLLCRHHCEPHEGLIMLVSTPSFAPQKSGEYWKVKNGSTEVTLTGDLENDINNLEEAKNMNPPLRWNWQQLLRALSPHAKSLKVIYILGSPEPNGSYKWLKEAKDIINSYIINANIEIYENPIEFEDFENLLESINDCIENLRKKGIKDKDILIDITGGQKTASVVGAIATLGARVTFQYVETTPDPLTGKYRIWAYDVAVQSPISI